MLWFSGVVLLILTIHAWQSARDMKADEHSAGLRRAYLAAMICGVIGALAFFIAALI